MKAVSHLSYPKPSLMCQLFDILVRPVAEYGSEIWSFMQAEEMERVYLWILQIHGVSWKQLPTWHVMMLCWACRALLWIQQKVSMVKHWLRFCSALRQYYITPATHNYVWAHPEMC